MRINISEVAAILAVLFPVIGTALGAFLRLSSRVAAQEAKFDRVLLGLQNDFGNHKLECNYERENNRAVHVDLRQDIESLRRDLDQRVK